MLCSNTNRRRCFGRLVSPEFTGRKVFLPRTAAVRKAGNGLFHLSRKPLVSGRWWRCRFHERGHASELVAGRPRDSNFPRGASPQISPAPWFEGRDYRAVGGRLASRAGTVKSAGVIVDAQNGHFGRCGQDFAKRMHPLAGILAPELIELVKILHLDLELQGRPAVAAG